MDLNKLPGSGILSLMMLFFHMVLWRISFIGVCIWKLVGASLLYWFYMLMTFSLLLMTLFC